MPGQPPCITTADGRRTFACSPVALLVFVVNEQEEVLLLAHPERGGCWEVVNGALEAGETVVAGALRETREEAGAEVQVRPLGAVHVSTFHYDEQVRYMLRVGYLMAYEGGRIQPGDDMAGSRSRWWALDDLRDEKVEVLVPSEGMWWFERAVELYRLWAGREVVLQPELVVPQGTKAAQVALGGGA
jgi:8-oxo-dGTP pyrophosphatase MutT (NUDIX family)